MIASEEEVGKWCSHLVHPPDPAPPLENLLAEIPRLESLENLPVGTPVLSQPARRIARSEERDAV